MATLIVAHSDRGGSRRCDAVCHRANPKGKCHCICGGRFHGIGDEAVENLPPDVVDDARQHAVLAEGEHVQLRIGA